MGKVLIEKLLRVTEVEKIYLLMRVKKGKNPSDRLNDVFSNPVSSIHGSCLPEIIQIGKLCKSVLSDRG